MKSILKFSALALLATALMASCAREMNVPEETGQKIVKTFTCVFAQPDTKLAVTDAGKTTWEVGDEIMIHGGAEGASRQLVTLTADDISADGKQATITVVDMEPYDRTDAHVVSQYYAQYPARLVPEGNMYYECRFTATDDFLMAACDKDDVFEFYNLCGIISYTVDGEFDSVVFSGNNGETVGYETVYQVRVRNDESGMVVNYNKPGNGSGNPVPMKNFESELNLGETNYIFLPAGAKFSAGFTFKFYDGVDLVKVAKTETPVEIGPSQILALGDISARLEDYVAPTTSDHKSEITGAQDLSAQQANCFVITAPGAYKFPALKGSSDEEAGNVWDVELLWETYNNAEEVAANSVIAAVDFEDNWIYFKTPDALKPGNALIAAKDANDKIIWSWHIWIPQTTIATNTFGLFDKELMDRNLGALVDAKVGEPAPVESYGLTYQWGRKDPFPGPASATEKSNAAVAGTAPSEAAGQITVGESILHPTVLGHMDDADWLTAPDNTLWQNDTKTIYDPCPAGYKVPARDKEQPLMSDDLASVTGWASSPENRYFLLGDPSAVFPLAGYRDDYSVGKVNKCGIRVAMWTSYASADKKGYLLDIRVDEGSVRQKLTEGPKARGGYVRCVKLESSSTPEPPQPVSITIDGDMSDWANVKGESGDRHTFKAYSDDQYLYFYSYRANTGRYSAIWGGEGYIYIAFDLDGDETNGVTLNSNGPYDFIGFFFPYGGTAEAPEIIEAAGTGDCMPADYTLSNLYCKGIVKDDGAYIEYRIPRADLPTIPNAEITITSWGNKDLSKVVIKRTL